MNELEATLKLLELFLVENNAPICKYLNPGLDRLSIIEFLDKEGFILNEEFITLYQWHNGIDFPNEGILSPRVELIPFGIPYSLDLIKKMYQEVAEWAYTDDSALYMPFMGSGEDDLFLIKNEPESQIYFLSPASIEYFVPSFKSISAMIDFILTCYQEKILIIEPETGLVIPDRSRYFSLWASIAE